MDSVINRISILENGATKAEKKFISFMKTANQADMIYNSITEMSELSGIGEASILRFCRKLGFKGYQEFKLVMAQDLAREHNNGGETGIAARVARDMTEAINSTLKMVDYAAINKAVGLIISASRVFCFGGGNSGIAAVEMRNKLMKCGILIDAEIDPHFQAIFSSNMTKDDLLILISVSGSNKDLIEVANIAAKNNVPIIILTNYLKSPLSRFAEVLLYCVRKQSPHEGGSLVTKVSQLFMIDTLCSSVIERLGQKAKDAVENAAQAVINKLI